MTEDEELPETDWQRMETADRTAYLAPLIGQRVRITRLDAAVKGRRLFGPAYPLPTIEGTLYQFQEVDYRPGIRLIHITGMMTFYATGCPYAYNDLYDVQLAPEPETRAGPDYDGADVYEASEVACPRCGARLRIVQRVTVEAATPEDEDG